MSILSDFKDRAEELHIFYLAAKRRNDLESAQKYWEEFKFFTMMMREIEEEELMGADND
jgi:hypothetical protein